MMSLDWESRRKLTAIFHQLADSGPKLWPSPMTWIGRRRVWVGVCYGTREVWLRRQSTELFASRTCPASGITTTADYGHSGSLGDSEHIYRLMIITRKIEMYRKSHLCGFPGWRINFSFWQELTWVTLCLITFHDHRVLPQILGLVLLCFMVIIIYHLFWIFCLTNTK